MVITKREHFRINIQRIYDITNYLLGSEVRDETIVDSHSRPPEITEDLIRAAVVLLHGILEDFLRGLAGDLLPVSDRDTLRKIPLVGIPDRRKTSFDLGDLIAQKGKSVDMVIEQSVIAYLERSSYNNLGEIKELFRAINLPLDPVDTYARNLAAMINRRHLIAHRADRAEEIDRQSLRPISVEDVMIWVDAVRDFGTAVLDRLGVEVSGSSEDKP